MNIITKTTRFLSLGEFVLQSATRNYAKVVAGGNYCHIFFFVNNYYTIFIFKELLKRREN